MEFSSNTVHKVEIYWVLTSGCTDSDTTACLQLVRASLSFRVSNLKPAFMLSVLSVPSIISQMSSFDEIQRIQRIFKIFKDESRKSFRKITKIIGYYQKPDIFSLPRSRSVLTSTSEKEGRGRRTCFSGSRKVYDLSLLPVLCESGALQSSSFSATAFCSSLCLPPVPPLSKSTDPIVPIRRKAQSVQPL